MENALGRFLQELRTGRQMSLNRLAAQAGVAKSTLSRWEAGRCLPRLPEMEALLRALGASPRQRGRALELIRAPRALACLRQETERVASKACLGNLPTSGDLLRAMRHRRGRTLEQVAGALQVAARTVSRWEHAEDWPSTEHLHTLCRLLGAHEAELAVLSLGPVALAAQGALGAIPAAPDAIDARLYELAFGPVNPTQVALMDLNYLALETQAWRLAVRDESVRPLVAKLYARHANQLWLEQRFAEAGRKADQAMDLVSRQRETPDFAFLAAIRSAHVAAAGGPRHAPARGTKVLQFWLPRAAPWPEYEAWMLSEMALYAGQVGQTQSALALAERACLVAERAQNPAELPHRRVDQVKVVLRCGQPQDALGLLQSEGGTFHPLDVWLLRAEALLALGDPAGAQDQLQRAYALLDDYALNEANIAAHGRRQADALARRL